MCLPASWITSNSSFWLSSSTSSSSTIEMSCAALAASNSGGRTPGKSRILGISAISTSLHPSAADESAINAACLSCQSWDWIICGRYWNNGPAKDWPPSLRAALSRDCLAALYSSSSSSLSISSELFHSDASSSSMHTSVISLRVTSTIVVAYDDSLLHMFGEVSQKVVSSSRAASLAVESRDLF
ncbi:hypothetical protein OGATHE_000346 [Ogataea polymorpha]|uniref:Uncharacterized protein n=1 Tax=Ogataea polymorpha TaxID=460523 RepID=A0A9P8PT79_9ASCO|nr:hypothetical protein OGATHE_000346 [Ogataea polymorpha]